MRLRYHYTLNGDQKTGWSLNVYRFIPDPYSTKGHETITTEWYRPKLYKKFADAIAEIQGLLEGETA